MPLFMSGCSAGNRRTRHAKDYDVSPIPCPGFLILEKKTDTLLHCKTKVVLLLIHIEVKRILFELVFLPVSDQKLAHSVTSVAILLSIKARRPCVGA
jgi:hypothetical protein